MAQPLAGTSALRIWGGDRPILSVENGPPDGLSTYLVVWDGADERGRETAAGVYLYRLEADGFVASKRMIVVK